ncbi:hypothetical protein BJX61DRAFT_489793, partial [Aspergillus egyptiacus]
SIAFFSSVLPHSPLGASSLTTGYPHWLPGRWVRPSLLQSTAVTEFVLVKAQWQTNSKKWSFTNTYPNLHLTLALARCIFSSHLIIIRGFCTEH